MSSSDQDFHCFHTQKRIQWKEGEERRRYQFYDQSISISEHKYKRWEEQQKELPFAFSLQYETLAEHSLFIPQNRRIYKKGGHLDRVASGK